MNSEASSPGNKPDFEDSGSDDRSWGVSDYEEEEDDHHIPDYVPHMQVPKRASTRMRMAMQSDDTETHTNNETYKPHQSLNPERLSARSAFGQNGSDSNTYLNHQSVDSSQTRSISKRTQQMDEQILKYSKYKQKTLSHYSDDSDDEEEAKRLRHERHNKKGYHVNESSEGNQNTYSAPNSGSGAVRNSGINRKDVHWNSEYRSSPVNIQTESEKQQSHIHAYGHTKNLDSVSSKDDEFEDRDEHLLTNNDVVRQYSAQFSNSHGEMNDEKTDSDRIMDFDEEIDIPGGGGSRHKPWPRTSQDEYELYRGTNDLARGENLDAHNQSDDERNLTKTCEYGYYDHHARDTYTAKRNYDVDSVEKSPTGTSFVHDSYSGNESSEHQIVPVITHSPPPPMSLPKQVESELIQLNLETDVYASRVKAEKDMLALGQGRNVLVDRDGGETDGNDQIQYLSGSPSPGSSPENVSRSGSGNGPDKEAFQDMMDKVANMGVEVRESVEHNKTKVVGADNSKGRGNGTRSDHHAKNVGSTRPPLKPSTSGLVTGNSSRNMHANPSTNHNRSLRHGGLTSDSRSPSQLLQNTLVGGSVSSNIISSTTHTANGLNKCTSTTEHIQLEPNLDGCRFQFPIPADKHVVVSIDSDSKRTCESNSNGTKGVVMSPTNGARSLSQDIIRDKLTPRSEFGTQNGVIHEGWIDKKGKYLGWSRVYCMLVESNEHICCLQVYARMVESAWGSVPLQVTINNSMMVRLFPSC